MSQAVSEFMNSANQAFAMYPGLDLGRGRRHSRARFGRAEAALRHAHDRGPLDRHDEPDRAALRHRPRPLKTKAVPNGDGSLFDHRPEDLHLGRRTRHGREHHPSRAGAHRRRAGRRRGISLFIVPKFEVSNDGAIGKRNAVVCGSLEHKMGIHGNATCVLNYDGAKGWLLGEANKGLAAMFVMMNEARLGVACQGPRATEAAYQNAVEYAASACRAARFPA